MPQRFVSHLPRRCPWHPPRTGPDVGSPQRVGPMGLVPMPRVGASAGFPAPPQPARPAPSARLGRQTQTRLCRINFDISSFPFSSESLPNGTRRVNQAKPLLAQAGFVFQGFEHTCANKGTHNSEYGREKQCHQPIHVPAAGKYEESDRSSGDRAADGRRSNVPGSSQRQEQYDCSKGPDDVSRSGSIEIERGKYSHRITLCASFLDLDTALPAGGLTV